MVLSKDSGNRCCCICWLRNHPGPTGRGNPWFFQRTRETWLSQRTLETAAAASLWTNWTWKPMLLSKDSGNLVLSKDSGNCCCCAASPWTNWFSQRTLETAAAASPWTNWTWKPMVLSKDSGNRCCCITLDQLDVETHGSLKGLGETAAAESAGLEITLDQLSVETHGSLKGLGEPGSLGGLGKPGSLKGIWKPLLLHHPGPTGRGNPWFSQRTRETWLSLRNLETAAAASPWTNWMWKTMVLSNDSGNLALSKESGNRCCCITLDQLDVETHGSLKRLGKPGSLKGIWKLLLLHHPGPTGCGKPWFSQTTRETWLSQRYLETAAAASPWTNWTWKPMTLSKESRNSCCCITLDQLDVLKRLGKPGSLKGIWKPLLLHHPGPTGRGNPWFSQRTRGKPGSLKGLRKPLLLHHQLDMETHGSLKGLRKPGSL